MQPVILIFPDFSCIISNEPKTFYAADCWIKNIPAHFINSWGKLFRWPDKQSVHSEFQIVQSYQWDAGQGQALKNTLPASLLYSGS